MNPLFPNYFKDLYKFILAIELIPTHLVDKNFLIPVIIFRYFFVVSWSNCLSPSL